MLSISTGAKSMEERTGAVEGLNDAPGGALSGLPRMGTGWVIALIAFLVLAPPAARTFSYYRTVEGALAALAKGYDASLPPLRVKDGRAAVEGDQPAVYPRPGDLPAAEDQRPFVIVFDTTGQTTGVPPECRAGLLVTAESMVLKSPGGEVRRVPLKELHRLTGDFVLSGEALSRHKETWLRVAVVIMGAVLLVYTFFAKLIQALLLGMLAVAAALSRGGKLSYGQGARIGLAALALPVALEALQHWAGYHIWGYGVVYAALAVAFAWHAGRQASGEAPPAAGEGVPLPVHAPEAVPEEAGARL